MDTRARDLIKMGDSLFAQRTSLLTLWQEIAENFYPERADFTTRRGRGQEFAAHLFSSFPAIARRELGNLFAAMLRPRGARWFSLHVRNEALDQTDAVRRALEYMTDIQRRAMYDPAAQFTRATREADHDFAAFGQAVIEADINSDGTALIHRCHHIRDCAWSENAEGVVDVLHRNWSPTARQLMALWPETASEEVKRAFRTDPETTFACRRIVVPARLYDEGRTDGGQARFPFVSLYVEMASETVLEEAGRAWFGHVVPRWQTVSDSQYARSPATELVLPDARTLQAVVRTLREAGEKFVDPPMIAVQEALRSDVALYAGGLTWADVEYDERLGEVLRPLTQDRGGMPIGFEIAQALQKDVRHGFFLDKIQMPEIDAGKMTAFEVRRRIEEHIRAAAPLFEPIEQEYNAPLCMLDFAILRAHGAFGPPEAMPPELLDAEVHFTFSSRLADAADEGQAAIFAEGLAVVDQAAALDPAQKANVNVTEAARDSLRALGWPAKWLNDEQAVRDKQEEGDLRDALGAIGEFGHLLDGKGDAGEVETGETADEREATDGRGRHEGR